MLQSWRLRVEKTHKRKNRSRVNTISCIWGSKTRDPVIVKFCMGLGLLDKVTQSLMIISSAIFGWWWSNFRFDITTEFVLTLTVSLQYFIYTTWLSCDGAQFWARLRFCFINFMFYNAEMQTATSTYYLLYTLPIINTF